MDTSDQVENQEVLTCRSCGESNGDIGLSTRDGVPVHTVEVGVAGRCSFRCSDCEELGTLMRSYITLYDDSDKAICWSCVEKSREVERGYRRCDWCEEWFDATDYGTRVGHSYACEDCCDNRLTWCEHHEQYECEASHNQFLQEYGYEPMWRFNSAEGEDEPRVFIGLELEYDNDTDEDELESHAKYLDQNYGLSITEDGSVSGFEVKTHPSSLAYYQQNQKWGWLKYLRDNDFEGWDATNAGIHANINPEAFDNASHLYKFIAFIYTNITDVGIFAGRLNPHYSSFTDRRLLTNKSLSYFKSRLGYWDRGERGSAVNTTNNGRIEVRLFRSSMNRERILAIVEFVHALIEYTRHLPTEHIRRNRDQVFKFSSLVRFASEQTDHEYLNFCENFHTWNEDGTWRNAEDDLLRYFKNSRNHWSNERMYPHYDSLEKFDAMAFTRDDEGLGMPEIFFIALNQEGM